MANITVKFLLMDINFYLCIVFVLFSVLSLTPGSCLQLYVDVPYTTKPTLVYVRQTTCRQSKEFDTSTGFQRLRKCHNGPDT